MLPVAKYSNTVDGCLISNGKGCEGVELHNIGATCYTGTIVRLPPLLRMWLDYFYLVLLPFKLKEFYNAVCNFN